MLRYSAVLQSSIRQTAVRLSSAAGVGASSSGGGRQAFHPFNKKDEDELVRVISAKPRHVLKHVRQLIWRSRKKELHFRNTVTQLMLVLQDHLRKSALDPAQASAIIEGTLEECVKLSQHDMAHLLFRSLLRFRKYGCTISIDALRHLFESYKGTGSTELMTQVANEMSYDPDLRPFCIAAHLFAGNLEEAERLRASVPLSEMTPQDIVAIIEGYDKVGLRDRAFELLTQLNSMKCKGADLMPIYKSVFRLANQRDDIDGCNAAMALSIQQEVPLDKQMFGNILRLKMRHVGSMDDISAVEADLKDNYNYSPDITGNSIIISACARLNHYGDKGSEEVMLSKVDTLLNSIEARLQQGDPDMDISGAHIRAVIRGFGAAGRPELIRKAWPRLQARGISDSPRVYNELIKWYALMGNVKDVLATKEEMDSNNIHCDAVSYSWILRALGKYYPRHVESLYKEIQQRNIRPDIGLYTTLVGLFGDLGQMDNVAMIEADVRSREESNTMQPSPQYFAVLIRIYSKDLDKVLELHRLASEKGYIDHQHVVTVLLHAYAQHEAGREHMQHLLASMPQWSTETYNVLLNMHGKANDVEKVKELLQKMRDEQVEMNDVTFGTLVTVFGKMQDTNKVKEIIEFLREKEGGAAISSRFYSVLASTLSKAGDVQGVNDAWEDLLASKLAPDTEVYNQFLALYGKHHNVAKMQSVMETMMRQVPPNPVTATTVLDMLGKSGRIAEMEALLQDMKSSQDAQPTAVTYHQVLNAYAKTADVLKMEKLHEEMTAAGIKDSHVTYNILADGYGRAKRFEQLEDLLKRRDEANIPLDELGYCVLIASYGRVRGVTQVKRLAENARLHYPHLICKKVAWAFVDAFCRCRDVPAMKEWMQEVFKIGSAAAAAQNGTATTPVEHNDSEDASATSASSSGGASSTTTVVATETDQMAMISYYCRAGLMDQVTIVVEEIEARGGELSYSALNALARGYATIGRFDMAVKVLHQMRDRNLVPDSSTTLALSSTFLKAGLHEQAQQIVQWRRQYAAVAEAEYQPDTA